MTKKEELTLKEYAKNYQEGNEDVLHDLIQLRERDGESYLYLGDKILNRKLEETKSKYRFYVEVVDIEAFMMEFLVAYNDDGEDVGILNKVDTSKTEGQVASFVAKSWEGVVMNKVGRDTERGHLSEEQLIQHKDNEEVTSLYDNVSFQAWIEVGNSSQFEAFLNELGGLEKILSERQFEVMTMQNEGKTQMETAHELNISSTSVHHSLNQASTRIKKAYTGWQAINLMSTDRGKALNDTIKDYVQQMTMINKHDRLNTFDYFYYTVEWLQQNSTKKDWKEDIEHLQKNKQEIGTTVVSVIIDHLKKSQFDLVGKVLNVYVKDNKELGLTDAQKDRFVNAILQALRKHNSVTEERITDGIDLIIETLGKRDYTANGKRSLAYDGVISLIKGNGNKKKRLKKDSSKKKDYKKAE